MKHCFFAFALLFAAGCAEDVEPIADPDQTGAESGSGVSAPSEAITASFSTGDVATLAVPEMNCQLACFPKVKRTLEGVDGIELVELVEQTDDVAIDDRRVTVRFAGDVTGADAVAALEEAGYPDSSFE